MAKKFASSASLLQAAAAPMAKVPAATVPAKAGKMVQVNLKVQAPLADALAQAASAEGTTQKVIVCRALQAAGFPVDETDLINRSNHRRAIAGE